MIWKTVSVIKRHYKSNLVNWKLKSSGVFVKMEDEISKILKKCLWFIPCILKQYLKLDNFFSLNNNVNFTNIRIIRLLFN